MQALCRRIGWWILGFEQSWYLQEHEQIRVFIFLQLLRFYSNRPTEEHLRGKERKCQCGSRTFTTRLQLPLQPPLLCQCCLVEGKAFIGDNFLVTDCTRQATSAAEAAAANVLQRSETAFNKVWRGYCCRLDDRLPDQSLNVFHINCSGFTII